MKKLLTLLLLSVVLCTAMGQNQRSQEEQLGIQYYQNGEFEKAAPMFERFITPIPTPTSTIIITKPFCNSVISKRQKRW